MSFSYSIVQKAEMLNIFDMLDIADTTKQDYLTRLPKFIAFTHSHGLDRNLLLDYKRTLQCDETLGVSSKNKYLVSARIALRELYRQGKLPVDLSVGVKSFRQSSKHKVVGLSEDEVDKVCTHLHLLDDSLKNVRLKVIVSLLLFQGLRQIEICRLNIEDIDLANNRIYIVGKGCPDHEPIHIHPETHKALMTYMRKLHAKHGPLFTHLNRKKSGARLSTRGLRMIFQSLLKELEIDKTTHGTRHFYTTQLVKHFKSDLTTVAKFTRHSSLEMLNIYNDEMLLESKSAQIANVFPYVL